MQGPAPFRSNGRQTRWLVTAIAVSLTGHLCLLALPGPVLHCQKPVTQRFLLGFRQVTPAPTPVSSATAPPAQKQPAATPAATPAERHAPTTATAATPTTEQSQPQTPTSTLTRHRNSPAKLASAQQHTPLVQPASSSAPASRPARRAEAKPEPTRPPIPQPVSIPPAPWPALTPVGAQPDATELAAVSPAVLKPVATSPPSNRLIAPHYLDNPRPSYPPLARQRGWQGDVLVRVSVDETGRVVATRLEKSSGHRVLDRSALKQVRRWRFVPASRGETRVAAEVSVPIRFRLRAT